MKAAPAILKFGRADGAAVPASPAGDNRREDPGLGVQLQRNARRRRHSLRSSPAPSFAVSDVTVNRTTTRCEKPAATLPAFFSDERPTARSATRMPRLLSDGLSRVLAIQVLRGPLTGS